MRFVLSRWARDTVTATLTLIHLCGHSRTRMCWWICTFALGSILFSMCTQFIRILLSLLSISPLTFSSILFFRFSFSAYLLLTLWPICNIYLYIFLRLVIPSASELERSLNAGGFLCFKYECVCVCERVHEPFHGGWSLMGAIVRWKVCKKWEWKRDKEKEHSGIVMLKKRRPREKKKK